MIASGFVNVLKPTGLTSSDVVCKVKKALKIKKVGHLGTLDPAASGVLPVAFGKATKFFDYFLKKDKKYIAVAQFGVLTDTLDSFGNITKREDVNIKKDDIIKVLPKFIGKINQVPPIYSAIKINGKKACDIARSGETVELTPREIEIFDIKLLGEEGENQFRFEVHCSAGTYIRTLFNDIANELKTYATTPVIIRTASGNFDVESSVTFDDLEKEQKVISIEEYFKSFSFYEVKDEILLKKLLNGVKLTKNEIPFENDENFFLKTNGKLIGMYHYLGEKLVCDVFLYE